MEQFCVMVLHNIKRLWRWVFTLCVTTCVLTLYIITNRNGYSLRFANTVLSNSVTAGYDRFTNATESYLLKESDVKMAPASLNRHAFKTNHGKVPDDVRGVDILRTGKETFDDLQETVHDRMEHDKAPETTITRSYYSTLTNADMDENTLRRTLKVDDIKSRTQKTNRIHSPVTSKTIPVLPTRDPPPSSSAPRDSNNSTQRVTLVLLVTYARSGSSWLGDIVSRAARSFYSYEPFHGIIHEGYYKKDFVCFNNDTCRKPRKPTETHEFAIDQLSKLFSCQLDKNDYSVRRNFYKSLYSKTIGSFKDCLKTYPARRSRYACTDDISASCQEADIRIVKTIRLSMDLVEILMKMYPMLKVIHLVRDPRAIANSRGRSGSFKMTRRTESHSRDMCNRMSADLVIGSTLRRKFPNRLTFVMYEELAERPVQGAEYVYKFLNTTVTPEMKNWVYNSTHANEKNKYFGTTRTNSSLSANHWRYQSKIVKVRIIDRCCTDVYEKTGYLPLPTVQDLRNDNVPSRAHKDNFGFD